MLLVDRGVPDGPGPTDLRTGWRPLNLDESPTVFVE